MRVAGYAEADPSADVDGWDTAHKVSVLARLAFETAVDVQSLGVRGIRDITLQDMEAAPRPLPAEGSRPAASGSAPRTLAIFGSAPPDSLKAFMLRVK